MKTLTVPEAARIIEKGGVVAYPTETFYGLAVNPSDRAAVKRIFRIKKRDRGKPIMIVVSSVRELERWACGVGLRERKLVDKLWPGPVTFLFRARKGVVRELTAGTGKIGIRLSSEPIARRLARLCGGAITATSANVSGFLACRKPQDVVRQLGDKIDGIVSKKILRSSKGSTILDVTMDPPSIVREGMIGAGALKKNLRK